MCIKHVFIFLLTGDSFSVNGVFHPAHQDYTAVSIVTVMKGEELNVVCNDDAQSGDWVAESLGGRQIVDGDPELIVGGGITRFGVFGNTLFFLNSTRELEGVYSCAGRTLRIQLTFSMRCICDCACVCVYVCVCACMRVCECLCVCCHTMLCKIPI